MATIEELLQYGHDTAVKTLDTQQILGIYAKETDSETVRFVILYIPTFRELCLNTPAAQKQYFQYANAQYCIKDIRSINEYDAAIGSTKYKMANSMYQDSFNILGEAFFANSPAKLYENNILPNIIVNLLHYRYCEMDRSQDIIKTDAFIQSLSVTERVALTYFLDTDQKFFSVVKLIEASNISRPVFKNLFDKMVFYNVAKVENKGVKGTLVEFFNQQDLIQKLEET